KSYYERHGRDPGVCHWLPPLFRRGDAAQLLSPYRATPIHVLGLSCYTWNWALQVSIARQVKAENPDCLVVAGGPDPDYKDPEFFRKYPDIDVVVVNDGEIPFLNILETRLRRESQFDTIRGLYLPAANTRIPVLTGPPEVPTVFDHSPYLDQ